MAAYWLLGHRAVDRAAGGISGKSKLQKSKIHFDGLIICHEFGIRRFALDQTCDVMILCAHPDDAEFGAAGTVARWVDEGRVAVYIICTNGDKGSGDHTLRPDQISAIRKKEPNESV